MSVRVLTGDCRSVLPTLPDESVQCVVTSPPYWGLRDYGVEGQLGLEKSPEEYVANMVAVFRAVRRLLRDDGTLWLNLGDSYAGGGTIGRNDGGRDIGGRGGNRIGSGNPGPQGSHDRLTGLKPKDLVGIPWRVALALQADGWYLRSDVIWHKENAMPESVEDRPTRAHEYLFLLTKRARYFYDGYAIRERLESGESDIRKMQEQQTRLNPRHKYSGDDALHTANGKSNIGRKRGVGDPSSGRNARSVWTINTQPYPGAHFATMPPRLAERCILAGTSPRACVHCGAAWERVLSEPEPAPGKPSGNKARKFGDDVNRPGNTVGCSIPWQPMQDRTLGWRARCSCEHTSDIGRCVVLDPFGGAGTTSLVADRLGRDAIIIELNAKYAALASERLRDDAPLFADVEEG